MNRPLLALGLAVGASHVASDAIATNMPLRALISEHSWSQNDRHSVDSVPGLLDEVRITSFSSQGAPDAHILVELARSAPVFLGIDDLSGAAGTFGLALGDYGSDGESSGLGLGAKFIYGAYPQAVELWGTGPNQVVGAFLVPGLTRPGTEEQARIRIATPEGPIQVWADGNVYIPSVGLDFAAELFGTGVIIEVEEITLDLHATYNDPSWPPAEWSDELKQRFSGFEQGALLTGVSITLPPSMGGTIGIGGAASDRLWIDDTGVNGTVDVDCDLDFDLGGAVVALTHICVDFVASNPTLCGGAGRLELPAEHFGCDGAEGETLAVDVELTADGAWVAVLEVGLADCTRLSAGVGGGFLQLGGEVEAGGCEAGGSEALASFLRVEAKAEPFSIEIEGFAADPGVDGAAEPDAHIGAIHLGSELLRPATAADHLLLPQSIALDQGGWCVGCDPAAGASLPPVEVGGTGVELCASDVVLDFAEDRVAWDGQTDAEWKGLYASQLELRLPLERADGSPVSFTVSDLAIGSGGVSGTPRRPRASAR